MAKKLKGQQIILAVWVAGAPGSYKAVTCLTTQGLQRSADEIDTSSKCDDGYGSSLTGRKNITMPIAGVSDFAPAAGALGYQALEALWDSAAEFDFKLYQANAGTDFVAKYGTGVLLSLNDNFNDGEAVVFDGQIKVNGAIVTVDPHA